MDSSSFASILPSLLCFLIAVLSLVWVLALKSAARKRRDAKMNRKVADTLEYEARLEAERRRRSGS